MLRHSMPGKGRKPVSYTHLDVYKRQLLWVLDKTKTAMGARTLRGYIEQPLIDKEEIEKRLTAIEELNSQMITREELREYLNPIYDLERLIGRISYQTANPRDLIAFKTSLGMLPPIKTLLSELKSPLMQEISEELDTLTDLYDLVEKSIQEEPPISIREGNMIRDGYNEDVDRYRTAKTEGKSWLAEIETKERERTGIKNKMCIRDRAPAHPPDNDGLRPSPVA